MTERDEEAAPLAFAPHLRPEIVPGDAVHLVSEHGVMSLLGDRIAAVVPLLDGTRDLQAVLRDAAPHVPPAETAAIVGRLLRDGVLERRTRGAGPPAGEEAAAYWSLAGGGPVGAAGREPPPLRVLTLDGLDDTAVRSACLAAGLQVVEDPAGALLDIVVCEDYLSPSLRTLDAAQRAAGRPWLPAKPVGSTVWAGPVFRPGGGCWNCLAHRLRARRAAQAPVQRLHGEQPVFPPRAALPVTVTAGASLVALRAAHWLAGRRGEEQDELVTFDTLTLRSGAHRTRRRPQCPECGDPMLLTRRAARPPQLAPRRKTVRSGGGHRAHTAEQMLRAYDHLVDPVTGLVKEIRREECGPGPLHVHRAGHNLALGTWRTGRSRTLLRQESSGKGRSAAESRAGALCEALERVSGVWQGDEPHVRGSLRSLAPEALSPEQVQLWHPRQFRERDRFNRDGHPFHLVPDPFDVDAELDWSPVWSLTRRRRVLLPAALLYFEAPDDAGRRMVRADSNGCAAGGTLEDAVLQALLELVERDAVALWWYNMTRQPAVDADAFGDPWHTLVREEHARLGREVWVLDVTSDLGVPVMAALSRRTAGGPQDIVFGFGAHLDPAVALTRAVAEMNQMLPAVLDARPDGTGYRCTDPAALDWWRTATVAGHPYLAADPGTPPRSPADYGHRPSDDLLEDVGELRRRLESRGMEVLMLDQTRPDIGLPVVRMLVPGLRHFWPRFAPGRLYDVPVRLGRLPRPTRYEDLNPVSLFV